ncbi:SSI family serine proteinase inhibitor [Actinoalloteichus hymeniacidonis]|uniref:Subtilisin inhibitor-like protein n=1 Tax=Actinoalloteichus hymeniacidonis TaxID=340345 RepID=A0AAC9N0Z5_9PSEU|nr:SSI family serine proteinase inhibitor [Actinoalloteichus hymeniacidonis]AOS65371.1 subtilisin inhibitor-like protein [Actinoalloteichus hymeniacidonis]MBB5906543.1 hypothetical protein [Actinoalloteichus hymeniacidonis]
MYWNHLVATAMLAASVVTGVNDVSGDSTAAPTTEGQIPTNLTLTISEGEGYSAHQNSPSTRTAVLTCDPAGGNHPDPALACTDLKAVGDRFEAIDDQALCTMIYQPYTATATGTIDGTPVAHEKTYSNKCILEAATGSIFAF